MKKRVLIVAVFLLGGITLSVLTIKSSEEHLTGSSVNVTPLPYIQLYSQTFEGISENRRVISFCPESSKIVKGVIIPLIHIKFEYSSNTIPYEGACY
jgi:hypothetical protein